MKERVAASLPVDCVVVIAMLLLSLSLCVAPPPASEATLVPVELADATDAERGALEKLRQGEFWPSRALGLMRLERFDCPESALLLTGYFEDKAWQVRSYAFAIAARRGVEIPESLAAMEQSALVARTILRARIPFPQARVTTAIERLRVRPALAPILIHQPGPLFDETPARQAVLASVYRRGLEEVGALLAGVRTRPG